MNSDVRNRDAAPTLPAADNQDPGPAGKSKPGKRRRSMLIVFCFVLAHLLGALTSVRAIMEVRTAQGAVAWAVALNTFPYVAVPAYWVFGRTSFHGYVLA